jgi:hypothetical protein
MRSESEIRDLVESLEENLDKLSFEEVVLAADELQRQLTVKRKALKKKPAKKVARRGLGSY